MRILHTILTKGMAGTERYVADLCNQQVKQHDVAILVRYDHQLENGLSFLSWLDSRVRVFKVPRLCPQPWMLWNICRYAPDIIHSHHKRDAKYIARLFPRIPKVGTLHMEYQAEFSDFDGLVCIAQWQQSALAKYFGKVRVINNWVPALRADSVLGSDALRAQHDISNDAFIIGAVGRFAHEKGLGLLLQAFVKAQLPNTYLVMVGDGPLRSEIENQSTFTTVLPGVVENIAPYYDLFDVFVLPSLSEPFGLVVLEAMSCGLPVIMTRSQGPLEISAKTGSCKLVDVGNVNQLSMALAAAYDEYHDKKQRIDYNLEDFDLVTQTGKIEAFYRDLIHAA